MKKICLFDLDGTLTDSQEGILKSAAYALASLGVQVNDLDTLRPMLGPPLHDSLRNFFGFNETQAEQAVIKYREHFSVTGMFENVLYPGIMEMLEELHRHDIKMAIATSKPTFFAKQIAEHFKITPYFSHIVGSELDGTQGKKFEVIHNALGLLRAETELLKKSAVMIGDRKYDFMGAQTMNIDSIAVMWGYG